MKARMLATAVVLMAVHSHAQPQGYILFSVRLSPNGSVLYELPDPGAERYAISCLWAASSMSSMARS